MNSNSKIAAKDFFDIGHHLYEDQLGWDQSSRVQAKSTVSRKIFDYYMRIGANIVFYYVDDGRFYGIHTERYPKVPFFIFKDVDPDEHIIYWHATHNTHDWWDGTVLLWFKEGEELWSGIAINGHTLEEVLERSYIETDIE